MASLRYGFTLVRIASHIGLAAILVGLLFPFVPVARQRLLIRWWSRGVLNLFRIDLRVIDHAHDPRIAQALRPGGSGAMLVMNHVSWLDIYIVHAQRAARFVAKSEIARWPLLGFLTDRTGAIFIERGKRHAVREVNHRVAGLIRAGDLIGVFPEGTTSEGDRLLPFHANLIQSAIDAGAPVIVGGLRYREVDGGPTTATSYVGETSLWQSIARIARHGPLVAELHLIESIDPGDATRHAVGRRARDAIAAVLGLEDAVDEDLSTMVVVADGDRVSRRGAGPAGTGPGTAPDPRDELL